MTVNPGAHGDEKRTRTQLSSVSILRVQREKEELTKEPLTWHLRSHGKKCTKPQGEIKRVKHADGSAMKRPEK